MVFDACCRQFHAQKTLRFARCMRVYVFFLSLHSKLRYRHWKLNAYSDIMNTNAFSQTLPRIHTLCIFMLFFQHCCLIFLRFFSLHFSLSYSFFYVFFSVVVVAGLLFIMIFFVAFFHFLLGCRTKITRCMHSRNVCADCVVCFFSLFCSFICSIFIGFVILILCLFR